MQKNSAKTAITQMLKRKVQTLDLLTDSVVLLDNKQTKSTINLEDDKGLRSETSYYQQQKGDLRQRILEVRFATYQETVEWAELFFGAFVDHCEKQTFEHRTVYTLECDERWIPLGKTFVPNLAPTDEELEAWLS